MAKKSKKEKTAPDAATSRADQLRAAVEGAFGATAHGAGPVQKRAQELADELVGAATRLREALVGNEDIAGTASKLRETLGGAEAGAAAARVREAVEGLRPPSAEQVDALRAQVDKLEARVAALEAAAPAKPPARRPPARKPAGGAAEPPPATARTARSSAARKTSPTPRKPPATGGQDS
jgi:polyhydroxyalkanoate synthesis regulator phasin